MLLVDWEGNGNICKPYVSIYESLDRDAKKKKYRRYVQHNPRQYKIKRFCLAFRSSYIYDKVIFIIIPFIFSYSS